MRRTTVFIIVLLLLGTVTTIAIAWGLAAFEVRGARWDTIGYRTINGWSVISGEAMGRRVLRFRDQRVDSLRFEHEEDTFAIPGWSSAHDSPNEGNLARFEYAFGWPLLTMRYTYNESFSRVPRDAYESGWIVKPIGGISAGGIVRSTDPQLELGWALHGQPGQTAMPLMPVFGPFALSAFMWAALWLGVTMLVFAPSRIRRVVRTSRSHCVNCNYPLAQIESPACPECGHARSVRIPFVTWPRIVFSAVALVLIAAGVGLSAAQLAMRFEHPHPMLVAAAHNDVDLLTRLIDEDRASQVPFDPELGQAMGWAIIARAQNAVALLIERGANLRATGNLGLAIHEAAAWGNTRIFDMLVQAGCDPNATELSGVTPLHLAVYNRDGADHVQTLLEKYDFDLDTRDANGRTPLHRACLNSVYENVVAVLIDSGADVNIADNDGVTPLMTAVSHSSVKAVRALLDAGADVSVVNADEKQVLHEVSYALLTAEVAEVVRLLIEAGACLDCPDPVGDTPLHYALRANNEDIQYHLLRAGASPYTSSGKGLLHVLDWKNVSDEFVRFLVHEIGLDMDEADSSGRTPRERASAAGRSINIQPRLDED